MGDTANRTCSAKGFRALLVAQFFGALNDNLFKLFVTLLVVNTVVTANDGIGHLILINVFFIVPYILFSAFAGSMADRFSKTRLIQCFKLLELLVMCAALYFLALEHSYALLVVLFFMGWQSTLFSPAKYGVLPEILDHSELSKGNGLLEFGTFIGIIVGTALAGVILNSFSFQSHVPGIMLIVFAIVGCGFSLYVTPAAAANPGAAFKFNPLSVFGSLKQIREQRGLFLTVVAIGYFWSIGSLYQLNLVLFAKSSAGLDDLGTSLLLASLGVGIGCGSIAAGRVSEGKVELGLVPIGAMGLALSSILVSFTAQYPVLAALLLLGLGFSAGFYIVPLNSFLQENSPSDRRGNFIAASNFISFVGMLLFSYLLLFLIDGVGLTPAQVFFVVGLSAVVIAVYICTVLPEVLLRCLNWILIHSIYRMRISGEHHIPETGGALLVCNHVSMVDACLLMASLKRPVRFLMYKPYYESKLVNPFAKAMGAIPIQSGQRDVNENALAGASEAIEQGELVCIFAEGALTRTGHLLKFKRGLERIMVDANAPIIPVYLDQMWGSIFSWKHGRLFLKFPKALPYPMSITFGPGLAPTASSSDVRQAVQELSSTAFSQRVSRLKSLSAGFVHSVKSGRFRPCMSDSDGRALNWNSTLASAMALRKVLLNSIPAEEQMVGVILPPSVPAALTNIALLMAGKTPINLNWTASDTAFASAIEQSELKSIICCSELDGKMPPLPGDLQAHRIEDLLASIPAWCKLVNWLAAFWLPSAVIERFWTTDDDEEQLATVLFSSGSTGTPKGVMLTQLNISSNCTAMHELFPLTHKDGIAGVLPFFHSFGFTGTLWFPLLTGCRVIYHGNPLASAKIGDLVQQHNLKGIMTTPTFLSRYTRKCSKEQFASLAYVMVGAERLPEGVRTAFVEKFAIEPLEGYGATELSPLAIINVRDFKAGSESQVGNKPGTVGQPIPGVAVRIVDPDSNEILDRGAEGMLLVRGPNVMKGYLGDEVRTAEVLRDGWYATGDIASMDTDGFVSIVGRVSRFSKIAGEMVPHGAIEEEIQQLLGEDERICAVTGIEDEEKGERLVVLLAKQCDTADLIKQLRARGLPNLWIPRADHVLYVEHLPYLGSGKLDLQAVRNTAVELTAGV